MFPHIISVEAIAKYKLKLRFEDGIEGVTDLSHLVGRGVFKIWNEGDTFFQVRIDSETNALVWSDTVDIDPDNLYLQLRGLTFEEFKVISKPPEVIYATD